MTAVIILLIVIAVVAMVMIGIYNNLVQLKVRAEEAWSTIDTQLKKRYDLIPNLVETVKGYAKHESEVFQKVTEARSQAMQANTPAEHAETENMLSGALKSLFAVAESYPDLKANENFLQLQNTLQSVENDVNASRVEYNAAVRSLNIAQDSFPGNIFAGMFGFAKRDFFELDSEEERKNVKVSF
ncbi:MAG: LemA family protein [Candidatus Gracilibacteria bacterium]